MFRLSFDIKLDLSPVVDDMLEVLAHPDLLHELVLVSVHAGQLTHMGHGVLETVSKLEIWTNQNTVLTLIDQSELTWKASTLLSLYWT